MSNERSGIAWGWRLVFGILWVVLGTLALHVPVVLTFSITLFLGWLLLIGGIVQAIYALWDWKEHGGMYLLLGLLYVIFGLMMINNLVVGTVALTSFVAIFFLIQGVVALVIAFQEREHRGWMIFSGIISLFFAVLILGNLLGASVVLLGFLLGLHMIFSGFGMIANATFGDKGASKGREVLGFLIILFILTFFFMRVYNQGSNDTEVSVVNTYGDTVVYDLSANPNVLQSNCAAHGGSFNVCGPSMCRIDLDGNYTICTRDCVPICSGLDTDDDE